MSSILILFVIYLFLKSYYLYPCVNYWQVKIHGNNKTNRTHNSDAFCLLQFDNYICIKISLSSLVSTAVPEQTPVFRYPFGGVLKGGFASSRRLLNPIELGSLTSN